MIQLTAKYLFFATEVATEGASGGTTIEIKGNIEMKWIKIKIFRGNLNEAISLAKIDVTLKVMLISTNEVASFQIPWRSFP